MAHNKRILYTRHDGGVNICTPALECITWLANGDYWTGRGIDLAEQIERAVAAGHHESAARRFVYALDRGGCTTAEAFEIIRDRDCAHLGTAHELVSNTDLPSRYFRDAWCRGHNGGPIDIDLTAARRIQLTYLRRAEALENARRRESPDFIDQPLELNWGPVRDRLRAAETPEELRRIWPEELAAYAR